MRVFINGFGRIGRTVLRAWLQGGWPGVQIAGINDIADAETCAYLLEYDSVFGPLKGGVTLAPGALLVAGHAIPLTRHADLSALSDAADATLVLGANDHALTPDLRIVSNASCTTNALAPLARLLDQAFGISAGWMTTIHCYTGSQPTVDAPRSTDPARNRAAALSMVPTTTSAGRLLDRVLPALAGRIDCAAVRVPTASVSAVDLCVVPTRPVTVDQVNTLLRAAGGVIGWTDRPLVSSDLRARSESIVMALPETRVTGGGLIRVFGWYDNEWGFSCRMLDMALRMG